TIEDCIIRNNTGSIGSAIMNLATFDPTRYPRLTMRNTEVRDNTTDASGAGLTVPRKVRADITNCIFANNHADRPGGTGGATATGGKSRLVVTGSQFTGNTSNQYGGALSIAGAAVITDSVITGNSSAGGGGGIQRAPSEDANDNYSSPGSL